LTGDLEDGLALAGEVRVAAGRYVQDFTVKNFVIAPSANESGVGSGNDLLQDVSLDLRVRTVGDSFIVQNNLTPEIHML
ncbi:hypothetical protein, partial [Salmonella enterica]|uniref:hypothetical protein n=1 Tax=Salmonella enterica TaxID=28901 RepID=UPI0015CD3F59